MGKSGRIFFLKPGITEKIACSLNGNLKRKSPVPPDGGLNFLSILGFVGNRGEITMTLYQVRGPLFHS